MKTGRECHELRLFMRDAILSQLNDALNKQRDDPLHLVATDIQNTILWVREVGLP